MEKDLKLIYFSPTDAKEFTDEDYIKFKKMLISKFAISKLLSLISIKTLLQII